MKNETVDPDWETVFKTEKGLLFIIMVFELGCMGKSLFILEELMSCLGRMC